MPNSLRVLHLANVMLGSPYTGLPLSLCRERYDRFPEVFDSVFSYIEAEKIDLVLVAGNLYGRYLTSDDAARLIRKLSEAPCRFVIAPGDQDPYAPDSLYASGRLPKNVSVFAGEALERIDFDDLGASVYGWAILGQRSSFKPLAGMSLEDPDRINLVTGCCDIGGRTLFAHVSTDELASFGADYAAFSHGSSTQVRTAGKTKYCHASFLEGRSFEELGVGGFRRVDIYKTKKGTEHTISFVPASRHRYETLTLDITGATEMNEVVEELARVISKRRYGSDTSLRVILEGEIHPAITLHLRPGEEQHFSLYHLDIVDRTFPTLNAEAFERDMSVRGELYRTLLPRLNTQNLADRIAVAQALRAGLAALESRDITLL